MSISAAAPRKAWLRGPLSMLPAQAAGKTGPKEAPPGNGDREGCGPCPVLLQLVS